jgi:hypothetical protein
MIAPEEVTLRRRQAMGLIWIALAIILFCAFRAGWHAVFLTRWWNVW